MERFAGASRLAGDAKSGASMSGPSEARGAARFMAKPAAKRPMNMATPIQHP